MHGSVNLPDSGGEAVLIDGARMTFHLKLLNHPVLMTWKNTGRVTTFLDTMKKQKHTTSTAKLNEPLA